MVVATVAGLIVAAACSGEPGGMIEPPDENTAPTLAPVADQVVLRNTITPRSVTLDLLVDDADGDRLTVTVASSDETVVPGTELTCDPGPCPVVLTPGAGATAEVTVTVTVSDARGGRVETDFSLAVRPRLVTSTGSSGAGSLRAVIEGAEAGDVVGFETSGAFATPVTILLDGQIAIGRPLTIEGPGAIALALSGDNASRVFRIEEGVAATLGGLSVRDGVAPLESLPVAGGAGTAETREGGGILLMPRSSLTLEGVTVADNVASGASSAGGGIANVGGTLSLAASTVSGNTAAVGAGVSARSGGAEGAVTIVRESTIEANAAAEFGGGIGNMDGNLRITGSTVVDNEVPGGRGGGVHTTGSLFLDGGSRVVGNRAGQRGGGLHIVSATPSVIGETAIEGNTAFTGGGVYVTGELEVRAGTRIEGNSATDEGGGVMIQTQAPVTMDSVVVHANQADYGAGVFSSGVLQLTASTVTENHARVTGGGVFTNGQFAFTRVLDSTIGGNHAVRGGGTVVSNPARLEILKSELVANTADEEGGGIMANGRLVAEDAVVRGNVARNGGGAHLSFAESRFIRGTIAANEAVESGGGVYVESVNGLTIFDATVIEDNQSGEGGGGIALRSFLDQGTSRLTLADDTRVQRNVSGQGGGIWASQSGTATVVLTLDSATVGDNRANVGGGIHASNLSMTIGRSSSVENNRAASSGGGVRAQGSDVRLEESVVIGNQANLSGGGFSVNLTELTVVADNCVILGNIADADRDGTGVGGGISSVSSTLSLTPLRHVCLNNPDDISSS